MRKRKMLIPALAAGACAMAVFTALAIPNFSFATTTEPGSADIQAAQPPVKPTYDRARTAVLLDDPENGLLRLDVPGVDKQTAPPSAIAVKAAELKAGDLLGVAEARSSTVVSYGAESGFRSLISVADNGAPRNFEFPLELPSGSGLTIEKDGSVSIRDADGNDIGGIAKPWATDAKGATVPTHFATEGNKLVQIIEHGPGTAYPVVADPKGFWGWAACIGAVTVFLGTNVIVAGKVAKLVARFGSLKRVMQIAYRAYKQAPKNKKLQALAEAGITVGGELLGVYEIQDKCFN